MLKKKKKKERNFPRGPVAGTVCVQFRAPGFSPWSRNWIPHGMTRNSGVTTEDPMCHSWDLVQLNT